MNAEPNTANSHIMYANGAHPPPGALPPHLHEEQDAEGDMDIDSPSPAATAVAQQQQPQRNDQYTSSEDADASYDEDDAASLTASRTPYANGSVSGQSSVPSGAISSAGAARPINFAAVDPALYGLRRSVRCPSIA